MGAFSDVLLLVLLAAVLCLFALLLRIRRLVQKLHTKPKTTGMRNATRQTGVAPAAALAPSAVVPPEVVAAIAAAVAQLEGPGAALLSVQPAAVPAVRTRGAWGMAGVRAATTPFDM